MKLVLAPGKPSYHGFPQLWSYWIHLHYEEKKTQIMGWERSLCANFAHQPCKSWMGKSFLPQLPCGGGAELHKIAHCAWRSSFSVHSAYRYGVFSPTRRTVDWWCRVSAVNSYCWGLSFLWVTILRPHIKFLAKWRVEHNTNTCLEVLFWVILKVEYTDYLIIHSRDLSHTCT